MRRFIVPAVLAALGLSAPAALAQGGITPVSPKRGDSVPAGRAAKFKMDVTGPGQVFVHVCKNKRKTARG